MWYSTSRELMYYVDMDTGLPATDWTNPWTKEKVSVMHVANNPVQGALGHSDDTVWSQTMNSNIISTKSDVNLFYPNPLADVKFMPYAPYATYEGGEYFKHFVPKI